MPATAVNPSETTIPRLLTVPRVAEITGWSRAFVYKAMSDGRLRSVRVGRTRRVREGSLLALIEANTIG